MEKLNTRKRLMKLNMPEEIPLKIRLDGGINPFKPVSIDRPKPEDLRASTLATRSRINTIMMPTDSTMPIQKTNISPQSLEKFKDAQKPVVVNGTPYYSSNIQPPELEGIRTFKQIEVVNKPIKKEGKYYKYNPVEAPKLENIDDLHVVEKAVKREEDRLNEQIKAELVQKLTLTTEITDNRDTHEKFRINKARSSKMMTRYLSSPDFNEEDYHDMEIEERKEKLHMRELDIAYEKLKEYLIKSEMRLDGYKQERDTIRDKITQVKGEHQRIKLDNEQKIKAYEEQLKQANQGIFNPERQPYETPEQYREGLIEATKVIDNPQALLIEYKTSQHNEFRHNMLMLIPKTDVIEYAYNKLNTQDDSSIPLLNQRFPDIERDYLKTYGKGELTDIQFTAFLEKYIKLKGKDYLIKVSNEEPITQPDVFGDTILRPLKHVEAEPMRYKKVYLVGRLQQLIPSDNSINVGGNVYSLKDGFPAMNNRRIDKETNAKLLEHIRIIEDPDVQQFLKISSIKSHIGEPKLKGDGLIKNIPTKYALGVIEIDGPKLYYENRLSIFKDNHKIHGFRTVPISQHLTNIIMNLIDTKEPTQKDISKLDHAEQQLYNSLLRVARIHKEVTYHDEHDTIEFLKKRLQLVEAEIEAGNTNKELLSEVYDILYRLVLFRVINKTELDNHVKEIKRDFNFF